MALSFETALKEKVEEAIAKEIESLKDEILNQAIKNFDVAVRKAVGEVGISIANFYSVERCGPDLLIRVKIECKA